MTKHQHWTLGAKLALVAAPFLLLALVSIGITLWVSWQLDGGAAAVNEAGRMRMQAYRMSLAIGTGAHEKLPGLSAEFQDSLELLRIGDPERPLFMPWDESVRAEFSHVEKNWQSFRAEWIDRQPASTAPLPDAVAAFVAGIDSLVAHVERHLSHWTALLHLLQMGMMALAVLGALALLYTGYLFVLEPVGQLKEAIQRIQGGDLGARVSRVTSDEFGTLAEGFNGMAEHLQFMYRNLEAKVTEKTAELEEKRERLQSLYEVTTLIAQSTALDELARGFARSIGRIAHADGVALRWSDQSNRRYLMLASEGLPAGMAGAEQCIVAGDCHCGAASPETGFRTIPIVDDGREPGVLCRQAGFKSMVAIPIRMHERITGEVELFFHARISITESERSLLEALTSHLGSAMENLRLNALEKEAAVSQERNLLARELHDSIAQSLAFLKIQVKLMQDALHSGDQARMRVVLDEIDTGVRESYGDVRELLLHFRTRPNDEGIESALATTLRKFEHQSGITATLQTKGHGMPLQPDVQVQVLHIIQEALSNVRKHARASRVWLDVVQQPAWRFEVRDNGSGFVDTVVPDETHVGLRIMQERAERIGASLEITSTPGRGTSMVLTLPLAATAAIPQPGAPLTLH
jgi:two-component system nitrate/nitrite sensor histidine kinase NarX